MMLITLTEILDLMLMTAVIGFIFMSFFVPQTAYGHLKRKLFDWKAFKFAALVTAPGIVLHELSHKFTAMGYGMYAVFHAWPLGLGIGLFLKLIHAPFVLIAPGYVSIACLRASQYCIWNSVYNQFVPTPLVSAIIAFAGPAINLVLWLGAAVMVKNMKKLTHKQKIFLILTSRINMILFIFNMIPFGPLDGAKVLSGLLNYFGG